MKYVSTRGTAGAASASQAVLKGIAADGGLYTPEKIPKIDVNGISAESYPALAAEILGAFMTDYTHGELLAYAKKAYASFETKEVVPVVDTGEDVHILELFRGPTCAFKDVALQILPYLLTAASQKNSGDGEICILVATSGDTGKAALEGFADVPGTKIAVFYPVDGVSEVQRLQMATQEGENVGVFAVRGNFDDAQTGVKKIFADGDFNEELAARKIAFSSANSINWGRLAPQIVYYFSAYRDMLASGKIEKGKKINIAVPSGNFGNILAAYFAKKMGLPVNRLICASNKNNVLTDFINTGVYDRNRPFYTTVSPSMDILISSNVERLLYELSAGDGEITAGYMNSLAKTGRYALESSAAAELGALFRAGWCSEDETEKTIKSFFVQRGYLPDTHTAVALNVLEKYRAETGDSTPAVVTATASPFKFCPAVLKALTGKDPGDGTHLLEQLSELAGLPVPPGLAGLGDKKVRFDTISERDGMKAAVAGFLGV